MYKGYILIASIVIEQDLESSIGNVLSYRFNLLLQDIQIFPEVKDKQTILNYRWLCIKIQLHCNKKENRPISRLQI